MSILVYKGYENDYEKTLLIDLNNENKSLSEKISLVKKAAIYLNKPYLFYLLAHFLYEDTQNNNL